MHDILELNYKDIKKIISTTIDKTYNRDKSILQPKLESYDYPVFTFSCKAITTKNRERWFQKIYFPDLDNIFYSDNYDADSAMAALRSDKKRAIDLVASDMQINCDCPSYTYHGAAYNNYKIDIGFDSKKVVAPSQSKNKNNSLCKHLRAVIQVLPFLWSDILREIKADLANKRQ